LVWLSSDPLCDPILSHFGAVYQIRREMVFLKEKPQDLKRIRCVFECHNRP
jgi:hypothetical protein